MNPNKYWRREHFGNKRHVLELIWTSHRENKRFRETQREKNREREKRREVEESVTLIGDEEIKSLSWSEEDSDDRKVHAVLFYSEEESEVGRNEG